MIVGMNKGAGKLQNYINETFGNKSNRIDSRNKFSDLLNSVIERQTDMQNDPRLTATDLFGEQIQRLRDSAGANANATKRMLARGLMGRGGDITGAGASSLLNVDEQLNRTVGNQVLNFENLALGENRYQTNRGDNLLSLGLQGLQNLFGIDQGIYQDRVMQEQARKERRANLFGNLIQGGATAAVLMCWVAIELYGEDSNEFYSIQAYLMEHEKMGGALKDFVKEYKEHGEEWAKEIRFNSKKRKKAKSLFDQLYSLSKAA